MKQRAKNGEKSCLVYREVCASASQEVLDFLPSAAVCSRTMRNARSKTHPRQPKKLSQLTFSGPWLTTGEDRPRDFLQKDNGCGASQRIVLFATSEQVQHLASATEWYMDGNFAMAPALFTQLYIIRAPLGESAVTVLYILLERKTQATYEEMLELLLDLLDDFGLQAAVTRVVLDFELAAMNAVKSKLGSTIQIGACFFHLTQSTYRKVQNLGLTNLYNSDANFANFVGMLDALALLPPSDVERGMTCIQNVCHPEAEELVQYFDETYVNGRRRGRNGRPTGAVFPPAVWNQHIATLNGESRTNNFAESWNSMFKTLIGHKHPSVWQLIKGLRLDAAEVSKTLRQANLGMPPAKRKLRPALASLHQRQQHLCRRYEGGNMAILEFLETAGKNIRIGRA